MTEERILEIVKNWLDANYIGLLDSHYTDLENRLKFADSLENESDEKES